MTVLFDTNVILDSLLEHSPFADESSAAVQNAIDNGHRCLISASSATDLFYIIRKLTGDRRTAWEKMTLLSYVFEFASVSGDDILSALGSKMTDFEDAVVASAAARNSASYIVTRNIEDFRFSPVPAVSPKEFNELFPARADGKPDYDSIIQE